MIPVDARKYPAGHRQHPQYGLLQMPSEAGRGAIFPLAKSNERMKVKNKAKHIV
jgi:hypothetical protein